MEPERIQKALATAGAGSRRAIEGWIIEGRVMVNGRPADIGQKVTSADRITIDGRPIRLTAHAEATRVLLYKKRVGELVTRDDPEGRRTVFRKLPKLEIGRWIAIGRLDINTSGLLLMTNDGELARRLTHPSFEVPREYAVRVLGEVDEALLERLRSGVELDDGPAKFEQIIPGDGVELDDDEPSSTGRTTANRWFHVLLREGRNRLVRRLMESQGLQVSRLIRVAYGPVRLQGGQRSGSARELDADELSALLTAVGLPPPSDRRAGRSKSTRPAAHKPAAGVAPVSANPGGRARNPGTRPSPRDGARPSGRSGRKTGR